MFYLFSLLIKISSEEKVVLLKIIFKNSELYALYEPEWGKISFSKNLWIKDYHLNCLSWWDLSCESHRVFWRVITLVTFLTKNFQSCQGHVILLVFTKIYWAIKTWIVTVYIHYRYIFIVLVTCWVFVFVLSFLIIGVKHDNCRKLENMVW